MRTRSGGPITTLARPQYYTMRGSTLDVLAHDDQLQAAAVAEKERLRVMDDLKQALLSSSRDTARDLPADFPEVVTRWRHELAS